MHTEVARPRGREQKMKTCLTQNLAAALLHSSCRSSKHNVVRGINSQNRMLGLVYGRSLIEGCLLADVQCSCWYHMICSCQAGSRSVLRIYEQAHMPLSTPCFRHLHCHVSCLVVGKHMCHQHDTCVSGQSNFSLNRANMNVVVITMSCNARDAPNQISHAAVKALLLLGPKPVSCIQAWTREAQ